MVERVDLAMDGLEAAGTVDVADGRELGAFFFPDLEDFHHVGNVVVLLEPFADRFPQDGGSEGPKGFAPFDLGVQDVLHVGAARVAQDGTVAQSAWAPLHAPLEPAHDFAVSNRGGGAGTQRHVIGDLRHVTPSAREFVPPGLEQFPAGRIGKLWPEVRREDSGCDRARQAGRRFAQTEPGRADGR